ncbi:BolA family protein [Plasticicumulans sp.]|uniref:BolA family protein n=1 Tax=Plasticicumulans sp. TaxID=2307179 RepID=UPI000F90B16F|nr:BolA family protein [Plasticicumulans sp.]MBS0601283.1 BolA family transcriptional regulator [Pseudomonadota bacterium]RTL03528.1 MAG: BolA family transcriptional regulator [Xanthomonadales bacterium]HMV40319.1 BolA family protein [Plasticicumulans sp.]HMW29766.1 BolA family protein [Plasticicumulans sp.]HMW41709.1 BolA family protein [Plasticicumulans sp.]
MSAGRMQRIEACLRAAFDPVSDFAIFDDSAQHAGHAGAREGGHFRVRIVSPAFAGLNAVKRHRAVYAALGALMQTDIHALGIDARTPDEP